MLSDPYSEMLHKGRRKEKKTSRVPSLFLKTASVALFYAHHRKKRKRKNPFPNQSLTFLDELYSSFLYAITSFFTAGCHLLLALFKAANPSSASYLFETLWRPGVVVCCIIIIIDPAGHD